MRHHIYHRLGLLSTCTYNNYIMCLIFIIGHQSPIPVTDSGNHSCSSGQSSVLLRTSGATQQSLQGTCIIITTVYVCYSYSTGPGIYGSKPT